MKGHGLSSVGWSPLIALWCAAAQVYRDTHPTPMVCCDTCEHWVHCACDGITSVLHLPNTLSLLPPPSHPQPVASVLGVPATSSVRYVASRVPHVKHCIGCLLGAAWLSRFFFFFLQRLTSTCNSRRTRTSPSSAPRVRAECTRQVTTHPKDAPASHLHDQDGMYSTSPLQFHRRTRSTLVTGHCTLTQSTPLSYTSTNKVGCKVDFHSRTNPTPV